MRKRVVLQQEQQFWKHITISEESDDEFDATKLIVRTFNV